MQKVLEDNLGCSFYDDGFKKRLLKAESKTADHKERWEKYECIKIKSSWMTKNIRKLKVKCLQTLLNIIKLPDSNKRF